MPENHQELDTILGMLAYVAKFVPQLSTLSAPLREVKTSEDWRWGNKETQALEKIKNSTYIRTCAKIL